MPNRSSGSVPSATSKASRFDAAVDLYLAVIGGPNPPQAFLPNLDGAQTRPDWCRTSNRQPQRSGCRQRCGVRRNARRLTVQRQLHRLRRATGSRQLEPSILRPALQPGQQPHLSHLRQFSLHLEPQWKAPPPSPSSKAGSRAVPPPGRPTDATSSLSPPEPMARWRSIFSTPQTPPLRPANTAVAVSLRLHRHLRYLAG